MDASETLTAQFIPLRNQPTSQPRTPPLTTLSQDVRNLIAKITELEGRRESAKAAEAQTSTTTIITTTSNPTSPTRPGQPATPGSSQTHVLLTQLQHLQERTRQQQVLPTLVVACLGSGSGPGVGTTLALALALALTLALTLGNTPPPLRSHFLPTLFSIDSMNSRV